MRNLQRPGRSPIYSANAMVATSHPLATTSALEILRSGGNAMDAAICASAVLSVVEPQSTGIGGDCFVLYAPANGDLIAYNGSGRAPQLAEVEWYIDRSIAVIDGASPHSVTVPGAIDAWVSLSSDYGRLGIDRLLDPAIRAARDGYPVQQRIAWDWARQAPRLSRDPNAASVFLTSDLAPRLGTIHHQPKLAVTLDRIAKNGRDGFYQGEVAEDIVAHLNQLGGLHTLDDFANHTGAYVSPIRTSYQDLEIYECPPNAQGVIALLLLNILGSCGLSQLDPGGADRIHLEVEGANLAQTVRDTLVGDPDFVEVPTEALLSMAYAENLRGRITPERRFDVPEYRSTSQQSTIYLCVVDNDGNAASLINSIFEYFGSGICSPKSGILLQNRGESFSLQPNHPNCIAPGKRPLHTIIPAMAMQDGKPVMPFGVVGGDFQPLGQVHVLTNMMEYGMDPQEALDFPRAFYESGKLTVECGVQPNVIRVLAEKGHNLEFAGEPLGGGQIIRIDQQRGVLVGASDPRLDGSALGY